MNRIILAVAALCISTAVFAADTDAYIESSGVAGIDTGYRVKPNTRIAVDFAFTTTEQTVGARVFGADYNHTVLKTAFSFYISDNTDYGLCGIFGFGDAVSGWHTGLVKDKSGNPPIVDLDRHTVEYDFPGGRYTYYTNGEAKSWQTDDPNKYTQESTGSVTLFSTKDNSGKERPSKARIYGVKIYEKIDGEYILVHDFKPFVAVGKFGVPSGVSISGFKCSVTSVFIGNAAQYSTFTACDNTPVEVESPAYVTTGAVADKGYVDTGYVPTDKTCCEIDYSLNAVPSASGWLFSASGDGAYYGVYIRGGTSDDYYVHNGTGWHRAIASSVARDVNIPRTVVLDYPANKFYVHSGSETNTYSANAHAVSGKKYTGPIRLGCNYDGTSEFASIKIYGFRIYENGVKVYDYRPLSIDGIAGLKCSLTGKFISYPNNFTALEKKLHCGGDVDVVAPPYIQTDSANKQYIATGYHPISSTRFEVEYACAAARPSGTWGIFRGNNNGCYFGAYNNASGAGFINNNGWKSAGTTAAFADAIGIRRTAILDNVSDKYSLVTHTYPTEEVSKSCEDKMPDSVQDGSKGVTISCTEGFSASEYASLRIYSCRIFENGEKLHEYRPAVVSGVAGLKDEITGRFLPVISNGASNPQVYGGAFVPEVTSSSVMITVGKSIVLAATAPCAESYCWFKNGKQIEGGKDGTLEVAWQKGYAKDSYQAISVVEIDGVKAKSEPSKAVVVENLRAGTIVSVR